VEIIICNAGWYKTGPTTPVFCNHDSSSAGQNAGAVFIPAHAYKQAMHGYF
jgi:hypothetical protein